MRRFVRSVPAAIAGWLLVAPGVTLAHGADAPAPSFPGVLAQWRFDPLVVIGLVGAAGVYLWAVQRVAAAHPDNPHPRWRTWLFLGGLAAIAMALLSPIEAYEGTLFSVHMVQHMLLQLIAAPLLLAGAPITLTLRVASRRVRRGLLTVLHSRVVRALSFPVVAWVLFAATSWGWHYSTLYNDALENELLHYVQHANFLIVALLFWWPVVGADPSPWRLPHPVRLLYLFLAMPQQSFLGVAILQASTVLYPHYVTNVRAWGMTPFEDQQLGAVIMWVVGDMAFLAGMFAVLAMWMRHEERRTKRLDARLAAERAARRDGQAAPSA